jgi:hypothetical protein
MSISYYNRLEVTTRGDDLTPGIAAAVFDPAWLLARQSQLGELLGENGGTPVNVRYTGEVLTVTRLSTDGGPDVDLATTQFPWEAHAQAAPVRSAPVWTWRLRVDTGRELAAQLRDQGLGDRVAAVVAAFPLTPTGPGTDPDQPGAGLVAITAGRLPDGQAAYRHWAPGLRQPVPVVAPAPGVTIDDDLRDALTAWLAFCDAVVLEPAGDAWDPARLLHRCRLDASGSVANVRLRADAHRGGPLDWWSFDATGSPGTPGAVDGRVDTQVIPTRVQFRGMPNPRWWELDDGAVDFGRIEANPADLARMALLEFAFAYGNDHFAVPVRLPVGSLCRTTNLLVTDTFGVAVKIAPAAVASTATGRTGHGSTRWTMFSLTDTAGGVSEWFCLPATAADQLTSPALEDVLLSRDEMANLAWAIERVVEGPAGEPINRARELRTPPALTPPDEDRATLRWQLGTSVPPFWYPLVTDLADPSMFELQLMGTTPADDLPQGTLLRLGMRIANAAVPREGARLRREFIMARGVGGSSAVWCRRRANVGRGEGSSGLTFDRATPAPR